MRTRTGRPARSLPARGTLVPRNRRFVLHERLGKVMSPRSIGLRHEIEKTRVRRCERGLDRAESGVRDRPRRKTSVLIGVPGTHILQIGPVNGASITVLKKSRINSRRIAVEF